MVTDRLNGVEADVGRRREIGGTNIDGVYITIMILVHVAIGEESVRKQRKKDKFRESEELITRKSEARSPVDGQLGDSGGMLSAYRSSSVMFSSDPPSVFIGGPPLCCDTCVMMLAGPPADAMTYVNDSSGLYPSL